MVPDGVRWMPLRVVADRVGLKLAMVYKLAHMYDVRMCLGPRPTAVTRGRVEVRYLDFDGFLEVYKRYREEKLKSKVKKLPSPWVTAVKAVDSLYRRRLEKLTADLEKLALEVERYKNGGTHDGV